MLKNQDTNYTRIKLPRRAVKSASRAMKWRWSRLLPTSACLYTDQAAATCDPEVTRECMMSIERNIWRSPVSLATKLRLYNTYIPQSSCMLMHGLCLQTLRTFAMPETTCLSTSTGRRGYPTARSAPAFPVTIRLQFFGHICRAYPPPHHFMPTLRHNPRDWKRRPSPDLATNSGEQSQPYNLGLA